MMSFVIRKTSIPVSSLPTTANLNDPINNEDKKTSLKDYVCSSDFTAQSMTEKAADSLVSLRLVHSS